MTTRMWSAGQYAVTPFGEHVTVLGADEQANFWTGAVCYWVTKPGGDFEGAKLFPGDDLCTADEWARR